MQQSGRKTGKSPDCPETSLADKRGSQTFSCWTTLDKMLCHCETVRGGDQCVGVAMRKQGHQSRLSLKMAETPIRRASADTLPDTGKTGELFSHGSMRPSPASAVCVKGSETPSKLISGLNLSDRGTPDVKKTTLSVSSHPSPGYTPYASQNGLHFQPKSLAPYEANRFQLLGPFLPRPLEGSCSENAQQEDFVHRGSRSRLG